MSAHVSIQSKRPRLSLQIKPVVGVNSRASRAFPHLDPADPTIFNTLSNAYTGAIDRSTPIPAEPATVINTPGTWQGQKIHIQTPYQRYPLLPETPLTAHPISPSLPNPTNFPFPSTLNVTPPLSAGPVDSSNSNVFTFSDSTPRQMNNVLFSPTTPKTPRRRPVVNFAAPSPPYTHPCALRSILRNSPLPPISTKLAAAERRQSLRLKENAAKKVGYNDPLTQTITTNKYTKSHIDLLVEEASPYSPVSSEDDPEGVLDLALAYTGNETRDGGMTPGPFEEIRRRMAALGTDSPVSAGGIRKRKRKEKKRRWVWTLGQDDDNNDSDPVAAIRATDQAATILISTPRPRAKKPLPKQPEHAPEQPPELVRDRMSDVSESESVDIIMSETSSIISEEENHGYYYGYGVSNVAEMDIDMKTPIAESPDTRPMYRTRSRHWDLVSS